MRTMSLLLAASMLVAPLVAGADDTPRPYSLKREPRTGTNIPWTAARSHFPFDKRYDELTDEQRRDFKSRYEDMAEGDEPPFPELGLGSIHRPISEAAQKLRVRGVLSLFVAVASDGLATKVDVLSSPSPELARFAALVAMRTRFKPGRCGGSPCAMVFPIRIQFELR